MPIFDTLTLNLILQFIIEDENKNKIHVAEKIKELLSFIRFEKIIADPNEKLRYCFLLSIHYISDKLCKREDLGGTSIIISDILDLLPKSNEYRDEFVAVVVPVINARNNVVKKDQYSETALLRKINRILPIIKSAALYFYSLEAGSELISSTPNNMEEKSERFINRTREWVDEIEKYNNNDDYVTFDTGHEEEFNHHLTEIYRLATSRGRVLRTGVRALDYCVSPQGGFLPGLHMIYAKTGSMKSGLMINLLLWFQKLNNDQCQDIFSRGRVPFILYLSLENSKDEDLGRIYTIETGRQVFQARSREEVIEAVNRKYPIRVKYIYAEKGKISLKDIHRICEKASVQEGLEIIAIFVDYLECLRDDGEGVESKMKEERHRLGSIAYSANYLAKNTLNVPIISPHHLNRDADIIIAEAIRRGQHNIVKNLHEGLVSESKKIEKHAVWSAFMHFEDVPETNQKFITIMRNKRRGFASEINYFAQEVVDGIRIVEDYYLPRSLSQISTHLPDVLYLPERSFPNTWLQLKQKEKVDSVIRPSKQNNATLRTHNPENVEVHDNFIYTKIDTVHRLTDNIEEYQGLKFYQSYRD